MNELASVDLLGSASAIAQLYPGMQERFAYKKLLDALKAIKTKAPDLIRADIEAQVSLADAIDEAIDNGDARAERNGKGTPKYVLCNLHNESIDGAEVDRWRKLRAIPECDREKYYEQTPKPSRNGLFNWWKSQVVDAVDFQEQFESKNTSDIESLPSNHFGCIYADPPWQYENQGTRAATDNHYQTMTIAELCEMPVAELAAKDAHLHLWTTNAFIEDSFEVMRAWGFEYRSIFVWVKPQIGIGNYWRVSHELMLLGVRGNAKRFNNRSLKSWIEADRKKHSAKPNCVREMIEQASPGPYLELFGRKKVKGWTVFGNQIGNELQEALF